MMQNSLSKGLDAAVDRGLIGAGAAHRTSLAAQLAQACSQPQPATIPAALSGQALGRSLGLSRAAVHKHVEHLRASGFAIVSVAGAGYRLARPFTDLVVPEAVLPFLLDRSGLECAWMAGLPYLHLNRCGSTNDVLKQVAGSSPSGTLAVTDEQIGGRGRLGRSWASEAGKDLTFSVLLRPTLAPAHAHLLSLAAAVAVAEVLEGIPGLEGRVGIKWPNDVLLGNEKVCGILLEGSMDVDRLQWAVAGVGLNVNGDAGALADGLIPEEERDWLRRPRPVSLREHLGHEVPRAPLLAGLLAGLTRRWVELETGLREAREHAPESDATADLLAQLRERDVLAGQRVEVLSGPPRNEPLIAGEAVGIGAGGQLLVRSQAGETIAVFAGDVTVRGLVNQ